MAQIAGKLNGGKSMIIKTCPTCKKTFKARSKNSKNCSRECGDISAKKTRKMLFEQTLSLADLTKSKTTATNRIRDFWDAHVPGKELARQAWNKSIKLGEYK
jgi:hypothetical protein